MKTKLLYTALLIIYSSSLFSQSNNVITDKRDNKNYTTVTIGNQTWMSENLNFVTNTGSWCYNDSITNCNKYGRLYNWEAAKQACPADWHLPNESEWTILVNNLGGEEVAGGKLKSTTAWKTQESVSNKKCENPNHLNGESSHDTIVTNSSNFTALPAGGLYTNGIFDYSGIYSLMWLNSEYNTSQAWYSYLDNYNVMEAHKYYSVKSNGFSVRCIKD